MKDKIIVKNKDEVDGAVNNNPGSAELKPNVHSLEAEGVTIISRRLSRQEIKSEIYWDIDN